MVMVSNDVGERSIDALARAPRAPARRAQARGADLGRVAIAPGDLETHVIALEHDRLRRRSGVERQAIAGEIIGQYRGSLESCDFSPGVPPETSN